MDPRNDTIFTHATEIAEARNRAARRMQAERMREMLAPLARALAALRGLWTSGLRAALRQRAG